MVCNKHRLAIPSDAEYSIPQLRRMTKEVESMRSREVVVEECNRL